MKINRALHMLTNGVLIQTIILADANQRGKT